MRPIARRNVGALADMRADGEEGRIESAGLHRLADVRDLGIELERHAQIEDALHLGIQHFARQTVFRNAESASCRPHSGPAS